MLFTRTDPEYDDAIDPIDGEPLYRSLLVHGLVITLRRFPALLWAFVLNLFFAALTTSRIAGAIGSVTDHSLAAQPLHHGFDLGTMLGLSLKLYEGVGLRPNFSVSILLYFITYFLLVPGTLFCYQTGAPARLSTLLQAGVRHFWRFFRIILLTMIVMGLVLVPMAIAYSRFSDYLDKHILEERGFLLRAAAIVVIALVAALLRLYFDLVEVYTVQLGLHIRANDRSDRRVRKALLPALRALGRNFLRAYETFILLAILGIAAATLTSRSAMHSLAKPHAWPIFALTQAGLFLMLFTRFWQRGAETTLSLNHPLPSEEEELLRNRSRISFVPLVPAPIQPIQPIQEPPPPPIAPSSAPAPPTPPPSPAPTAAPEPLPDPVQPPVLAAAPIHEPVEPPLGESGPILLDD